MATQSGGGLTGFLQNITRQARVNRVASLADQEPVEASSPNAAEKLAPLALEYSTGTAAADIGWQAAVPEKPEKDEGEERPRLTMNEFRRRWTERHGVESASQSRTRPERQMAPGRIPADARQDSDYPGHKLRPENGKSTAPAKPLDRLTIAPASESQRSLAKPTSAPPRPPAAVSPPTGRESPVTAPQRNMRPAGQEVPPVEVSDTGQDVENTGAAAGSARGSGRRAPLQPPDGADSTGGQIPGAALPARAFPSQVPAREITRHVPISPEGPAQMPPGSASGLPGTATAPPRERGPFIKAESGLPRKAAETIPTEPYTATTQHPAALKEARLAPHPPHIDSAGVQGEKDGRRLIAADGALPGKPADMPVPLYRQPAGRTRGILVPGPRVMPGSPVFIGVKQIPRGAAGFRAAGQSPVAASHKAQPGVLLTPRVTYASETGSGTEPIPALGKGEATGGLRSSPSLTLPLRKGEDQGSAAPPRYSPTSSRDGSFRKTLSNSPFMKGRETGSLYRKRGEEGKTEILKSGLLPALTLRKGEDELPTTPAPYPPTSSRDGGFRKTLSNSPFTKGRENGSLFRKGVEGGKREISESGPPPALTLRKGEDELPAAPPLHSSRLGQFPSPSASAGIQDDGGRTQPVRAEADISVSNPSGSERLKSAPRAGAPATQPLAGQKTLDFLPNLYGSAGAGATQPSVTGQLEPPAAESSNVPDILPAIGILPGKPAGDIQRRAAPRLSSPGSAPLVLEVARQPAARAGDAIQPDESQKPSITEQEDRPDIDLDAIARDVYFIIKRRLSRERERLLGLS